MAGREGPILLLMAMALNLFSSASTLTEWSPAHATFYGDMAGNETMCKLLQPRCRDFSFLFFFRNIACNPEKLNHQFRFHFARNIHADGACGYGDLFKQGYGLETTALSTALFNNGRTCGACYQIVCYNSKWCLKGAGAIGVTATNFCPPNYSKPHENWCNPPLKHFDLSQPMFRKIAEYKGGFVPVLYRRVSCVKSGGVMFEMHGNPYWILVLVYNVGGAGEVIDVKIKGSSTGWIQMSRNWGQNWQTSAQLLGQSLSFQVTTSDGKMVQFDDVAPPHWQFGDVFEGKQNF